MALSAKDFQDLQELHAALLKTSRMLKRFRERNSGYLEGAAEELAKGGLTPDQEIQYEVWKDFLAVEAEIKMPVENALPWALRAHGAAMDSYGPSEV